MSQPSIRTASLVRRNVEVLLRLTPAFEVLQAEERDRLRSGLVTVGAYLVQPEGLAAHQLPGSVAIQTGATSGMAAAVDFPQFVAGLIQGVFQSIVTVSINQMKAYSELIAAAADTVNQFVNNQITDGTARDYLSSRYPGYFDGLEGKLELNADVDRASAIQRLSLLPLGCPSGSSCWRA